METFSFAMLKVNALAGTNHLLAGASQVAQLVKNLPANAEDTRDVGSILGLERTPGGGYPTHSSILVWRISWAGEPGGLQSMRLQKVRHD